MSKTQREEFVRAIGRWSVQTGSEPDPILLFAFGALGHPEGSQPIDFVTARHPREALTLEGLGARLDLLIDEVGVGEDFLVTALVRAIDESLARLADGREEALGTFRAMRQRMDALAGDPAATAAFVAEHGLVAPDLQAMREQVEEEIGRLEDPEWADAQRGLLEAWRRAARGLLRPERRAAWEAERFEVAARKMDFFFKGPPDAVRQPMPPWYEGAAAGTEGTDPAGPGGGVDPQAPGGAHAPGGAEPHAPGSADPQAFGGAPGDAGERPDDGGRA